ncbi:MAG: hypothetical protein WCV81_00815 [Microgenomates group bacterium]|jgi:hypothetical protein
MDYETEAITEHSCNAFLQYPNEKVIVVVRKHFITTFTTLLLIFLLIFFFLSGSVIIYYFLGSILLLFTSVMLSLNIGIILLTRTLTDWYFHSYIITNKKILEIAFSPFTSCIMNEVLLEQVRVTEVDMQTNGMLYDLLGIGNVLITFDRPTHSQEFELKNVKNYRKVGHLLCHELTGNNLNKGQINIEQSWYKDKFNPMDLLYREELKGMNRII